MLADTLALASRKVKNPQVHGYGFVDVTSPLCVIDYSTLTGTCITSLSNRYIGAMTNRKALVPFIVRYVIMRAMFRDIGYIYR